MPAKKPYTKPSMTEHKEVDVKPTRCPNCRSYKTHTYENGRAGLLYKCDLCNHLWSGVIVGRVKRSRQCQN